MNREPGASELLSPPGACFIAWAGAHALAGRHAQADALHAETLQRFGPHAISPYVLAIFEARRGRPDAAFERLGRRVPERDPCAMLAPHGSSFEPLYAAPRWPAFVASVGRGSAEIKG